MKYFILILTIFGFIKTWAQDGGNVPIQQDPPRPRMIKKGLDTFLDFQDGRVAGFFQVVGPVFRTKIGLNQIENTCNYQQILSQCKMEVSAAYRKLTLEWVQHPNPDKVGQILKMKFPPNNEDPNNALALDDNRNLFWYETLQTSVYTDYMKPDRLICNNLNWAKELPILNARMKIDSWATELMFQNPETRVNENQSISTAFDVVLKKIDNQTLEFESIGKVHDFSSFPPYLPIQVANLTFMNKENSQCQVSFAASIDEAARDLSDEKFRQIDPSTKKPIRNARVIKDTRLENILIGFKNSYSTQEFE